MPGVGSDANYGLKPTTYFSAISRMRGQANPQSSMFSYVSLEERIPREHPLRRLRVLVDAILANMSGLFDERYSHTGRPSIPPEHLLRALLLQTLFTVRSERLLMEQLEYNLLVRWFVGLGMDDAVWDRTVFSINRDRLLCTDMAREFFSRVLQLAEWQGFISDEHFSVDGTMIEAWASHKSFVRKDGGGPDRPAGRNPEVDFKGEKRSNKTHESSTDPEARLFKKGEFTEAKLRYMTHALSENRHGLIVDVETTQANGRAEWEAAERMMSRSINMGLSPFDGRHKWRLGSKLSTGASVRRLIRRHRARRWVTCGIERQARASCHPAPLEFDRAQVAQSAVPPLRIVVADVLGQVVDRLLPAAVLLIMDAFDLERSVGRFHRRVIVAVGTATHRHGDLPVIERFAVVVGAILTAPIRVMHQSGGRSAQPQRKRQRLLGELSVDACGHRPADQAAAEHVQHQGNIQPALCGRHVGNVGQPELVRRTGLEPTAHQVRFRGQRMTRVGRAHETPLATGLKTFLAHQPMNAFGIDREAGRPQICRQAGTAILAAVTGETSSQFRNQPIIAAPPCRGSACPPGIEATARDRQQATQSEHRIALALRLDPGVPHRDVLAKYAAARFRISTSIRSCSFSVRSRLSSACASSIRSSAPRVTSCRPERARRTQLAKVFSDMSKLRATSAVVRPPSITCRTASSRYCTV